MRLTRALLRKFSLWRQERKAIRAYRRLFRRHPDVKSVQRKGEKR